MKRTLPATNKEHALRTHDPRSGGVYVVDGRDNAGNVARQVVDGRRTEVWGHHNANTPNIGHVGFSLPRGGGGVNSAPKTWGGGMGKGLN